MKKVILKLSHQKQEAFVYQIDGQIIKKENSEKDVDIISHNLAPGRHTIRVEKHIWCHSALYYFNVINPLLFLWNFKFASRAHLKYREGFFSAVISFFIKSSISQPVYIEGEVFSKTVCSNCGDLVSIYEFICKKPAYVSCFHVERMDMPEKYIRRYIRVHIGSAAFYGTLLNILSISSIFWKGLDPITMLIFCVIITCTCGGMIYRLAHIVSKEF